jgi:nicotinamide-nucleotide amidase
MDMQRFRTVALVSTGTEILQGLYPDTNASFLAGRLSGLGLEVTLVAASSDDQAQLETTLRHAATRADLVICTGGLGPTADDVNRDVFARVFDVPLVTDDEAIRMMTARFAHRGRPMPERNLVQALVPRGATVFQNQWGTAPGYFLPSADERAIPFPDDPAAAGPRSTALIAMPGPPSEMRPMFEACALPIIAERAAGAAFVKTLTLHTYGRPESELGEQTGDLFGADPRVVLGILAKTYGVDFRITARSSSSEEMEQLIAATLDELTRRVGRSCIYGLDAETMATATAALLRRTERTVATAESCTGGLVAKLLTDIAGSSDYFIQGAVTYTNKSKHTMLGVRAATLEAHGAVSAETAAEMAEGARKASGAWYGIALTGIAGPTGGTDEKPVGLVYIGLAHADATSPHVRCCRFVGSRETIRNHAALTALDMIRSDILAGETQP